MIYSTRFGQYHETLTLRRARSLRCGCTSPNEATRVSKSQPLLRALMHRAQQADVPFHVPGHKHGAGVTELFGSTVGTNPLRYDLTEISGLDNLSSPSGAIAEAQQLAAAAFGADRTWFLVNGCSSGIHAAIMACTGPGDTMIVSRNCHLSVFSGMVLSGCTPWWVEPEVDSEFGIAHGMDPHALIEALEEAKTCRRRVSAVMVVSPTYFGVAAPIKELAHVCHEYRVPLLVDEAHGSHFGTHPQLPPSALQQGADCVMHSTHKVLSAMTQAAMLHVKGDLVNTSRISKALQTLQSSSPSYLLLASLDAATAKLTDPGYMMLPLQAVQHALGLLKDVPGINILNSHFIDAYIRGDTDSSYNNELMYNATNTDEVPVVDPVRSPRGNHTQDPLRITVSVTQLGLTGYEAAAYLEEEHGVVAELSTSKVVVFAFGVGSTVAQGTTLGQAFLALSSTQLRPSTPPLDRDGTVKSQPDDLACSSSEQPSSTSCHPAQIKYSSHCNAMTPREAFFSKGERVTSCQAVGRISAELLCPYPPGVPVVFPGEVITSQALQVLRDTLTLGGTVTGAADPTLQLLTVVTS
ncbi:hypothetical protein CEUSTIGMA_g11716.t1 [Chlamydomonas eustigma]|uniref:Orn/Lys/Arg decarboxylases family 1 pyridoxal-P attachment site domain-containing protein n=1 Tax=Chlamydomonas eustigma TaxID=1157962 RepID=A0A250XMH8_9CHLO|nr:hypothetical protein CEUSTIGMA_g11716.t1 [Chlamydomonas eustigma]|eukprot:GAX84294.1 hypothetical protein CEUSTIGMA_g11716.t1 [Chlamydomonas eustigma]